MLSDQETTERIKIVKQPGAFLHGHSSVLPAYREVGRKAGVPADDAHRQEQLMKGFEIICAMPYNEARKMVSHPVTCVDCHACNCVLLGLGFSMQFKNRNSKPVSHRFRTAH